jgi:hypothetical protein
MKSRRQVDYDDPEMVGRSELDTETLPLFGGYPSSEPATGNAVALGVAGMEQAAEHNTDLLEALKPLARELARRGDVTISDVRIEAQRRGILSGKETRAQLSALGALMQAAGLVLTGEYRKSPLDSTHARPQRVWALPRGGTA